MSCALTSIATATTTGGNKVIFEGRISVYEEWGNVYGDGQPRGLRVGTDPNNAIEFISTWNYGIQARTVSGGIATTTNYNFGSSRTKIVYRIEVIANQAKFFVNGNLIATHTTNIPTAALNIYVGSYDGGAGNVPVVADYLILGVSPTMQAANSRTTYTGDTSALAGTNANVSAKLEDAGTGELLAGRTITFTLDALPSVSAVTNSNGVAATQLFIPDTMAGGTYPMTARFAGDAKYFPSSDTVNFSVIVNRPPVADANGPYVGNEGSPIIFDASGSSDPDGDPLQYRWDFNNDGTWDTGWSSSPTASYTWYDNWTGAAKVEVSDGSLTDTDTASVTVNNVAPVVDAGPDAEIDEGSALSSSGSFTDSGADSWTGTVDYGDGTGVQPLSLTGKTFSLSHVYADNDVYTVTVTVTDDDGGVGIDIANVTVNNIAPTVDAGPDAMIDEGSALSSSGSFTDPGADSWTATVDYGDGTGIQPLPLNADKTFSLSYVYADNGVYTVTVTVTDDDGGVGIDTANVTVNNVAPTVDAGVGQTADEGAIVSLAPATFNDKGTLDTHTATIDWGDGIVEAGTVTESPFGPPGSTAGADGTVSGSHVYADNGVSTVTLTVEDDDGGITVVTTTVTVNNVAPTVEAGIDQTVSEADVVSLEPATFNDLGTLDTHTATIDWGDGSPVEIGIVTESPFGPPGSTAGANGTVSGSHVYADNDVYTVTVTVIDDDGGMGSDTLQVTVLNVPPTVDAGKDQTITAGDFVAFNGTFSDPGWLDNHTAVYDCGDGISESGKVTEENNPPDATGNVTGGHSYYKAGEFTVTLKVKDDDGGEGSDTLKVTVKSIAATVDFDPDTLNKSSGDKWVTVYIELPKGYDVWQIDGSKVLLNGIVPAYLGKEGWAKAESNESNIMDHDSDGILERMVKFDRNAVKGILEVGDKVQVTVTGGVKYNNGHDTSLADFKGQDVIRVIDQGKAPKAAPALVKGFAFAAPSAYPQPCNPEAWIPYTLAKDVEVTITIYSSSGRIIRTLQLGHQTAGAYIIRDKAAYWDGRNDAGEKVSSGIYFYMLKAGGFIATKKLVVLR